MPEFRVTLTGENLIMDVDGQRGRYGFEVTRYVSALDSEAAKRAALDMITSSPQLAGARNVLSDPPRIAVASVGALPVGQRVPALQPGFAFFPDDAQ